MDKMVGATIITAGFLGILVGPVAAQDPGGVAQPALPYVVDDYDPGRDPATDLETAVQLATGPSSIRRTRPCSKKTERTTREPF